VIWRGRETVPGAPEAVARLRDADAPIAFVTNSAERTPAQVAAKLDAHGIPDAESLVITAAMAAAAMIDPGDRVFVVGSDGLRGAVEARGATIVTSGPADVAVVGITLAFDYDILSAVMNVIRAGARFIATNDDATFPDAGGLLPGNGALVAAVATAAGVEPEVAGKPHEAIADLVRRRLGDRGVMVGDRPETDGRFAESLGYDFALVLTGVVSETDLPVQPTPLYVAADLRTLVEELL
jgi:glycerol-1-phosphatase